MIFGVAILAAAVVGEHRGLSRLVIAAQEQARFITIKISVITFDLIPANISGSPQSMPAAPRASYRKQARYSAERQRHNLTDVSRHCFADADTPIMTMF